MRVTRVQPNILLALALLAGAWPTPVRARPAQEVLAVPGPALAAEIRALSQRIKDAGAALRDYTMVMTKRERFGEEMQKPDTLFIKWARPQKVYLRYLLPPHEGREAIYVRGRNHGELTVHPNSFPDLTVNLDPHGSLAMDGNHHPLNEVSLLKFVRILTGVMDRSLKRGEARARLTPGLHLWGRPVTRLDLRVADGGFTHTMAEGETLWDVARKTGHDMYNILHHNRGRGWDEADDPDAGDRVFIPRYYISRCEVWIDDELDLPLKARFYDHYGQLYEEYEHRELKVNVGLGDRDFDVHNPDYDF